MNYRLQQGHLSDLNEAGFIDCFIALKQHLTVSKTPKLFRAALRELDVVLDDTKDMICL
jgi:hypothetical protein